MRRAVQRDLMPRRRNVRHKGQIFFVGVLRADKEGGRDLLLIENFQNWPGVFAGAVVEGQAEDKGYHWIDWNVCAEDATASHPDAAQILRNIRRDADGQDTCVVLLHDTKATGQTVKALPDMIAYFREQGYNFCTVAQMDALQCETK